MKTLDAADVMTGTVVTVDAEMTVADAARTMLQHHISGLPVVDGNRNLVGMITEGDLLRRAELGTERHRSRWIDLLLGPGRAAHDYVAAYGRKVAEIMSDRVISVTPDAPLDQVVALMERHRIKRLPVLRDKRLVGIVSRANLLASLVNATQKAVTVKPSDTAIRDLILAEINRQAWAPRATINIAVKGGMVELHGAILEERERAALRVVAENVPGVKGVVDHLIWVEPLSGMVIDTEESKLAE